MATMPNAENAYIQPAKLQRYLLDPSHKVGGAKLRFLESFGFSRADPEAISAALLAHGAAYEAAVTATIFGVKFEVDGPLVTPSGMTPWIRTVWQVDTGMTAPRFVSLKPIGKGP